MHAVVAAIFRVALYPGCALLRAVGPIELFVAALGVVELLMMLQMVIRSSASVVPFVVATLSVRTKASMADLRLVLEREHVYWRGGPSCCYWWCEGLS